MKIELTKEQYRVAKALLNACSTDVTCEVLCNVNYNPAHKRLEATDGHILRIETVDLGSQTFQLSRGRPVIHPGAGQKDPPG